jgi:hypothetical protein
MAGTACKMNLSLSSQFKREVITTDRFITLSIILREYFGTVRILARRPF